MAIDATRPPNFADIVARLPQARRPGVVFTYGRTIYNPFNGQLSTDLIHHESVHARQQGDDPEGWWDRYIEDRAFRLSQEIEAYSSQYAFLKTHYSREKCRRMIGPMSTALSSPLYGNLISKREARVAIERGGLAAPSHLSA